MNARGMTIVTAMLVGLISRVVAGQTPPPPPPGAAPAAAKPVAPAPVTIAQSRASWYSDRLPLRVGDIVTIVVDEQTSASERVTTTATTSRLLHSQLGLNVDSALRIGPSKEFKTGLDNSSNDDGSANRQGNLTSVLSARIVSIEASGVAKIEASKSVTVDGRLQEVKISGLIRPEDVSPSNAVSSNRIAEAVISYKGKKIGPRSGILGKILSILWP